MKFKQALKILVLAVFLPVVAFGQRDRADMENYIDTNLPSASRITAATLRDVLKEIVGSYYSLLDDNVVTFQYSTDGSAWDTVYTESTRYARAALSGGGYTAAILLTDATTYDVDGMRITNLAAGVDSTDAVTLEQLTDSLENAKGVLGVAVTGTATKTITITLDDSTTVTAQFTDLTGESGTGDNWGTQVVVSDTTLLGNGTAESPLKIDTAKIATVINLRETVSDSIADLMLTEIDSSGFALDTSQVTGLIDFVTDHRFDVKTDTTAAHIEKVRWDYYINRVVQSYVYPYTQETTNEVPTGTKNGTNKVFELAKTPVTNSVKLYLNGMRQSYTVDFTMSGSTINFLIAPESTDRIIADYMALAVVTPMSETNLKDLGYSSTDIDNRLIYLADSGIENQTIDLRGNSNRTSLSDDAVAVLIANGNNIIYEDL